MSYNGKNDILRNKPIIAEQNKRANIAVSPLEYGSSTWARTRDTRINSSKVLLDPRIYVP